MSNHYLVEVTQQQLVYVSIEAESPSEAIEQALKQQGEVAQPYPPELIPGSVRIVSRSSGEL